MLLSSVPTEAIRKAIRDARSILESLHGTVDSEILDALDSRLSLRDIFLSTTECPQHVKHPERARLPWKEGISVLPDLKSTHHLGKPVEDAFSAKLQRKLASTVPPRPIVQLSFDDAFSHLSRLFKDGLEVIGVLDYTDPQCLQVRPLSAAYGYWLCLIDSCLRHLCPPFKRRSHNLSFTYGHSYRPSFSTPWRCSVP